MPLFSSKMEYLNYAVCILIWCTMLLNENVLAFMLKGYDGDIYNNMMALMLAGAVSQYVALMMICLLSPLNALASGFFIMCFSGGFLYPSISKLNVMFPGLAEYGGLSMGVLTLAKLGAGSTHQLASLYVIW